MRAAIIAFVNVTTPTGTADSCTSPVTQKELDRLGQDLCAQDSHQRRVASEMRNVQAGEPASLMHGVLGGCLLRLEML